MKKCPVAEGVLAKPGQRNLIEMVGQYPKRGVGMKVFRKTWPDESYWLIMRSEAKPNKNLRLYGVQYWAGQL